MSVAFYPLEVQQGASLIATFQWFGGGKFMAPIEDVEIGYPTVLRVTGHGLNSRSAQPIVISGCEGLEHINSSDTEAPSCTRLDDNRIQVPRTTQGEEWEEGTGEITYWRPTGNVEDYSVEMNIRKSWHSNTLLHTASTANGQLVNTNEDGSTLVHIPASVTALWRYNNLVWDMDFTIAGSPDIVQRIYRGTISMVRGKNI